MKCIFFEEAPQGNISDDVSEEEAYNLYNIYALAHGFSIRWYRMQNRQKIFMSYMLFKGRFQIAKRVQR